MNKYISVPTIMMFCGSTNLAHISLRPLSDSPPNQEPWKLVSNALGGSYRGMLYLYIRQISR